MFFIADLGLNFVTGYRHDGELVMKPPEKVARHYGRSSAFLIDLLSTIPVDYFVLTTTKTCKPIGRTSKLFRIIRCVRLFRLFRIQRLFRYGRGFSEQLSAGIARIIKLAFLLMMFTHWNGCLIFLVSKMSDADDTWIIVQGIDDSPIGVQYTYSIFNSLSHMLCIGYGLDSPRTTSEVWMTIWSMTSGAALFSGIIGSITAVLLSFDSSGQRYVSHMDEVEAFLDRREVPSDLRMRIRNYMRLRYTGIDENQQPDRDHYNVAEANHAPRMFSERNIISELSVGIQRDLNSYLKHELIEKIPFLSGLDLPVSVGTWMSQVMEWQLAGKDDHVMIQDDPPEAIFFIQNGFVSILRDDVGRTRLGDGSYFGELPFCFETIELQPLGALVETQLCEMHTMSADNVHKLFTFYPDVEELMRLVASQRLKKLQLEDYVATDEKSEAYQRQVARRGSLNNRRRRTITALFQREGAIDESRLGVAAAGGTGAAAVEMAVRGGRARPYAPPKNFPPPPPSKPDAQDPLLNRITERSADNDDPTQSQGPFENGIRAIRRAAASDDTGDFSAEEDENEAPAGKATVVLQSPPTSSRL